MKYKFHARVTVSEAADDRLHRLCNRKARRSIVARLRHQLQLTVETIRRDALAPRIARRFGVVLRRFVVLFGDWLVMLRVDAPQIEIEDFLPAQHVNTNPVLLCLRRILNRNAGLVRLVGLYADNWRSPRVVRVFGMLYRGGGPIHVVEIHHHVMGAS